MKLVCFDLDGTLVDGTESVWRTLHDCLGSDQEMRKAARDMFSRREISYEEWARRDVENMAKKGVTRDDILRAIKGLSLMKGARETLEELRRRKYRTAVISGSMDVVLEKFGIGKLFDHVLIHRLRFDRKGVISGVEATRFDFEHKATGLRMISEKLGIKIRDTVFVGDNENDVEAARLAGFSISFNSKSERLDRVSDVVIREKNLKEILRFLP